MTHKEKLKNDIQMLNERFGKDTLLSLATTDGNMPSIRIVDAYFENGCFYTVVSAQSNKMKQIARPPNIAVCCNDYFSTHGVVTNLGWIYSEENKLIADQLKK